MLWSRIRELKEDESSQGTLAARYETEAMCTAEASDSEEVSVCY